VLRRVTKPDAADQGPSAFRFERFIKRADCVRIQVVTDHDHFGTLSVSAVQQPSHFSGPIDLRFPFANCDFSPAGHRHGWVLSGDRPKLPKAPAAVSIAVRVLAFLRRLRTKLFVFALGRALLANSAQRTTFNSGSACCSFITPASVTLVPVSSSVWSAVLFFNHSKPASPTAVFLSLRV
jgi:hypothetical protein